MAPAIVIERHPVTGDIVSVSNVLGEAVPFGVIDEPLKMVGDVVDDAHASHLDDDDVSDDDDSERDDDGSDDDDEAAMRELSQIFSSTGDNPEDTAEDALGDQEDFLDEFQLATDLNLGYADYLKAVQDHEHEQHGSHACGFCGEDNANHSCAGCKHVHYCSADCQREDWLDGHKEECHWVQVNAPIAFDIEEELAGDDDDTIGAPARGRTGRSRSRPVRRAGRSRTRSRTGRSRRRRFPVRRRARMRRRIARRTRRNGRRARRRAIRLPRRIVRGARRALWWRQPRWQSRWQRWRGRSPRFWRSIYRRYPTWRWWLTPPALTSLAFLGRAGYMARYRAYKRYWRLVCDDFGCRWVRRRGPWWESSWVPDGPPPMYVNDNDDDDDIIV